MTEPTDPGTAKPSVRETMESNYNAAVDAASRALGNTRDTANQTFDKTREAANQALVKTRDTANHALDKTKENARKSARRAANGIEANPLVVLASGVAVGLLAGTLLPRTDREGKLLGPVGRRINGTATAAALAAKDAGKAELDMLGISRNAARDQIGKVVHGIVQALVSASDAAAAEAAEQVTPKTNKRGS